ncbi:MAG: alpha/beta hydrolase [Bacteroidetes bacterium]|nr:alpha/beta hydrolase [Bacteroidota bacterium]
MNIEIRTFFYLCLCIVVFNSCAKNHASAKKIASKFERKNLEIQIQTKRFNDLKIRFAELNVTADDSNVVIFIHGAPGNLLTFSEIMMNHELNSVARLIAVDRLGYGSSEYGVPFTSIKMQAEAIETIIDKQTGWSKIILVGHSYGGPIAAKIAIDNPEQIAHIMLLAPAIAPEHEKIMWYSRLARNPPVKWFLSKAWKVATEEKFSHQHELEILEPDWVKLVVPVTYVHSKKDKLVSYQNMEYARMHFINTDTEFISLEKGNHQLSKNEEELIIKKILEVLQNED